MQTKTKQQKKMIICILSVTAFSSGFYYMIGVIKESFIAFKELDPILAYSLWFFLVAYVVFAVIAIWALWYWKWHWKKQSRKRYSGT